MSRGFWPRESGILAVLTVLPAWAMLSGGVAEADSAPEPPSVHSSDGRPGISLRTAAARRFSPVAVPDRAWTMAPGVEYAEWTEELPQGGVRIHLLTVHIPDRGIDQVSAPTVAARAPLSKLLAADSAVAGVNGDFFDITRTGAPLGVGVDADRGLLHAPRRATPTFSIGPDGEPAIGVSRLRGVLSARRQRLDLAGLNTPYVPANAAVVFTRAWGPSPGTSVTAGAPIRQLVVRGGVVRSNRATLTPGRTIRGQWVIGRGRAAAMLRTLRVGTRVRISTAVTGSPRVAVSGSVILLRDGQPATTDNIELHPRTAVGIDPQRRLIHLLVADGRSESSSGLTLLQLAEVMRSLGDEAALNLDGGGSSTMVGPDPVGTPTVLNSPSDGSVRPVPNGLAVR